MKNEEKDLFIEVALSLPLTKHLHYKIPEQLKSSVAVGKRVLVPLGKRRVTGYVVDLLHTSAFPEIRDIVDVLDDQPLFTPQHLKFYRWISDYYFFPLGGVIKTALPSSINIESKQVITLTEKGKDALSEEKSSPSMIVLKALSKKEQLSYTTLRKSYRGEGLYGLLMQLEQRGLITRELKQNSAAVKVKQEKWIRLEEKGDHLLKSPTLLGPWEKKAPRQASLLRFLETRREVSLPVLQEAFGSCSRIIGNLETNGFVTSAWREVYRDPLRDEVVTAEETHQPNAEQREIIKRVTLSTAAGKYAPFLLHGVTASGKTEVYLNAIEEVLKLGKEALVLVPEISLTPQLVNRFRIRFGDAIALFHSRLSPGERYDGWRRIQQGKVKIAIGTRSAIYAPFTRLGIIIVDEEHDASYKQEEQLRYNARDLALVRGKMDDATVILGSATPSLESYYNSQVGKCTLLQLPERVEGKPLPTVEIIDMKEERLNNKKRYQALSNRLREALTERASHNQQSLLFLNRRGFAPCIICGECGHVFGCPNCSVSLIHHQREKQLKCHYCEYTIAKPDRCPQCRGSRLQLLGWGTERLEEEIKALLPQAPVERMDRDTTRGKGGHSRVLKRFSGTAKGVLIGTQMIAKGHDMPGVTLVGVVSADSSLNFPDFRSSERTFQLLTQVAGRAGRGTIPGTVIIQTFNPNHYSIKSSQQQHYGQFYEEELSLRKELKYPPFSKLINFKMEGTSKSRTAACVDRVGTMAHALWEKGGRYRSAVEILGPATSPWEKIKGKYRYQMLLKGFPLTTLRTFAAHLLEQMPKLLKGSGVTFYVDVDPVSLL
jgi:primosomal protein N' (replication factor Y)